MKTRKTFLYRLLSLVCALVIGLTVSQPALSVKATADSSLYGAITLQATTWTSKKETVYATKKVAVRAKPSTSSEILDYLQKDEKITRTAYSDKGWSKVKYNGETVYVLTKYLTTTKPATWTSEKATVYATKKVAIRAKASTSSEILDYLQKGEKITRTAYSDKGWSKVKYNGETVYVLTKYLTTTKPVTWTTKKATVYAKSDVNIREKPSTSSDKLGTLKKGAKITRTAYSDNGWSKVTYNGKTAYISSDYLTTKKPSTSSGSSSGGTSSGYQSTVYITPTGSKYHYSSACAGKNAMARNINNVSAYYDPCKKCAQ